MRPLLLSLVLLAPPPASAAEMPGRVTDERGAPVAGAEIAVRWAYDAAPQAHTRSDAEGRFALTWQADYATVAAAAPGYGLALLSILKGAATADLRLPPSRTQEGRVLAPDGAPAAGVEVRPASLPCKGVHFGEGYTYYAVYYLAEVPETVAGRYTARTDAAGAFRTRGLPPGPVRLAVVDPRFAAEVFEVDETIREIRLRPGCRVRGRLTGPEGPLAGWEVSALPAAGDGVPVAAKTSADGSFLLDGLAPGLHAVRAHRNPGESVVANVAVARLEAPGSEAEVPLSAVPAGRVRGRVLDAATREPLAGARLIAEVRPPGRGFYQEGAVSGADGTFHVSMPVGPCGIRQETSVRGYLRREEAVTVAVKGTEESAAEVLLQAAPSAAGRVHDATGKPAPGVWVVARTARMGDRIACTAADGSFRLVDLPPSGEVSLTACRGDEGLARALPLKPPYPADLELTIAPPPHIALVGRVVDEAGRPVPHLPVCLAGHFPPKEHVNLHDRVLGATDAKGSYRLTIHDLSATYRAEGDSDRCRVLSVANALGDAGAERRMADLVVTSSDGSVRGRVLDVRGQPAAGAVVFWALGARRHRTLTDADGRFLLEGVPNRAITLVAHGAEGGTAFVRTTPGQEMVIRLRE